MFARALITLFGLACASAAALVFLPLATLFDPFVRAAAGGMSPEHWMDIFAAILSADAPDETLAAMFHLVWTIVMLICVLPITIVALVGAVGKAQAYLFYAGATGVLAAAMPWIVRAGKMNERSASITAGESHIALILFLTGVVAGTIYWLIAGRGAAGPRRGGWRESQPS
ncbi:MAG: hypothetical protein K2X62_17305 [Beijerinckiaceae bacterium]|jgi:hypothetical protein|nr:hypothetical protein [Beijerinckiaceae bacterium]